SLNCLCNAREWWRLRNPQLEFDAVGVSGFGQQPACGEGVVGKWLTRLVVTFERRRYDACRDCSASREQLLENRGDIERVCNCLSNTHVGEWSAIHVYSDVPQSQCRDGYELCLAFIGVLPCSRLVFRDV